jgi:hypothetical protein
MSKELTDDFVDCYKNDSDYKGGFSRIVAMGELPMGVDPEDPRVKAIVEKCKKAKEKK